MAEETSAAKAPTRPTSHLLIQLEETATQNAHQFRKLSKLHEKLSERDRMLSLSGALKLYKAYEGALEGVRAHKELVEQTLLVLGSTPHGLLSAAEGGAADVDRPGMAGKEEGTPSSSPQQPTDAKTPMAEEPAGQETSAEGAATSAGANAPSAPSSGDVQETLAADNVESGPESTQEGDLDIMGSPGRGTIPVGSTVAVRCRIDEEASAEEWIVATIVRGASAGDDGRWTYEVEDVEFEETASSPLRPGSAKGSPHKSARRPVRIVVSSDQLRRLPATEEEALASTADIKMRQRVLALFPGTTCLYAATVLSTPARRKKTRDFLLKFSDDDVPSRAIPARYVLRLEE